MRRVKSAHCLNVERPSGHCGHHRRVVLRGDQEPALQEALREVARLSCHVLATSRPAPWERVRATGSFLSGGCGVGGEDGQNPEDRPRSPDRGEAPYHSPSSSG